MLPPKILRFVPDAYYSLEQWQEIERITGKRYEYHDGHLVSVEAMAGGTHHHALLSGHVIREVGNAIIAREERQTSFSGCDALTSDLRIAVDGGKRYLYADAVVVCGDPVYDATVPSAIVNPVVVFEVLSPSSEKYDTGRKFDFYGGLDSVREYVIVHQDKRHVEIRHRADAAGPWRYTICADVDGAVALPSLDVELSMQRVYRNWRAPETDD